VALERDDHRPEKGVKDGIQSVIEKDVRNSRASLLYYILTNIDKYFFGAIDKA
jgi:hypothetical protein